MLILRGVIVCANITPGSGKKPQHSSFDHCDPTKNFVMNEDFFSKFNSNPMLLNQPKTFKNGTARIKEKTLSLSLTYSHIP